MKVTSKSIANHYGINVGYVEQIGSKQLFIARIDNIESLISYYTIVGKCINNTWYLTKQKYSVTTSKQLSQFARGERVQYVDDINNFVPLSSTDIKS